MKQKEQVNKGRYLTTQLLFFTVILFLVFGCSRTAELSEFAGVVVGKRDSDQILVVPNVKADTIQNKTEEELLAIAIEQNGVYFSVDQEIFETATVGTTVKVHFDPDDGEEATIPPRRRSHSVEIVTSPGTIP
jgi:hypothetical protein